MDIFNHRVAFDAQLARSRIKVFINNLYWDARRNVRNKCDDAGRNIDLKFAGSRSYSVRTINGKVEHVETPKPFVYFENTDESDV